MVTNGALVGELVEERGAHVEMPPDAMAAFALYRSHPEWSLRDVGRELGVKQGTMAMWNSRYRWALRIQQDRAEVDATLWQRSLDLAGSLRLKALQTLADGLDATFVDEYGIHPDNKSRIDAAKAILDRAGMRPYYAKSIIERTQSHDQTSPDEPQVQTSHLSPVELVSELVRLRKLQP